MPDAGAEPQRHGAKAVLPEAPAVVEIAAMTIDCDDPGELARFYAGAGSGTVIREDADSAVVDVWGVTLVCRRVAGHRAPSWPSSDVPMQMHLELRVDDVAAAEAALLRLGATKPEWQPPVPDGASGALIVLCDPAGHPFCIFAS